MGQGKSSVLFAFPRITFIFSVSTWSWGNKFLWGYDERQDKTLEETYNYLLDNKVNWFDTADSYGTGFLTGRSESLLGTFGNIRKQINTKKTTNIAQICTKIAPFPWIIGEQAMTKQILASQSRLQQPIDMLQLHWPPTLQWQEDAYLSAFSNCISTKKARQMGLSNFGPKGLQRISQKLKQQYNIKIYSNQVKMLIHINILRIFLSFMFCFCRFNFHY